MLSPERFWLGRQADTGLFIACNELPRVKTRHCCCKLHAFCKGGGYTLSRSGWPRPANFIKHFANKLGHLAPGEGWGRPCVGAPLDVVGNPAAFALVPFLGAMAVHYKLKSSRKFESVFFEGHEITGRELKAEIAAKQVAYLSCPLSSATAPLHSTWLLLLLCYCGHLARMLHLCLRSDCSAVADFGVHSEQDLGADAIAELTLTNPKTGEEYDDARGIPRNSSVLVTRKPPVRFPALQAASTAAAAIAAHAAPPSSTAPESAAEEGDEFGEAYSEQPQAAVLPDEDIAQALASQQQSWQAGLAAGGRGGRGGRGAGGRSGRGPGGFTALPQRPDDRPCPRCGQTGHRQQDCPTRDNPDFDVKRVHMPRGIPTSLLKASVAGEGSMVLPDGKIGTLRANEAAFLREMQASRTALAARAVPTALPGTSSAQPATTAALPAPAASSAPAEPLLLTQKPHDGATAASVPASAAPAGAAPVVASALAAVPQFAGASEYLPETPPVTAAPLNGGMPSLGGGLPGALGVMPGLFPPLLRPGLGLGQLPGLLPLGALVAREKPLSFEEFNRLKALAAAKQQPQPPPQAPRSKARSRSRSPASRQRSSRDKDGKRRSSSKRRERSASRSPDRRRSPSEKRPRKHHSEKESSGRHRHHSSSARHREAEPAQAIGAAIAAVDARRKSPGFSDGLDFQNSNGHHGVREPLSAAGSGRKAPSQLPPLPFPGSREHGALRPSYPAQQQQEHQHQPPRPLQNAPHLGRGFARSGRDAITSSHDRRTAHRDAAKLSQVGFISAVACIVLSWMRKLAVCKPLLSWPIMCAHCISLISATPACLNTNSSRVV